MSDDTRAARMMDRARRLNQGIGMIVTHPNGPETGTNIEVAKQDCLSLFQDLSDLSAARALDRR